MSDKLIKSDDYKALIQTIKTEIQAAQIKAAVAVNTELLKLYWFIGAQIVEKQKKAAWGDGLIKQLSKDLQGEFQNLKGFSHRNIKYMRQWYLFWSSNKAIRQQLVAQLESAPIFQIPWGQNLVILTKFKLHKEALFYVQKTIQNN